MEPPAQPTPTRRFERFDTRDCFASYVKGGFLGFFKGKDVGGPILDMSDFGLRFAASERLAIGSQITLNAKLVPVGKTLSLPVVIRWCTQDTRYPERAVVGVEFNGVTADQLVHIQKLREKMRRESTHH
ncbi:MAG TPA: PilZ domain-containing protein [Planctomycetota bacterium]|nr:PilZ domain-containing protein [Planctomycetota bacterium]